MSDERDAERARLHHDREAAITEAIRVFADLAVRDYRTRLPDTRDTYNIEPYVGAQTSASNALHRVQRGVEEALFRARARHLSGKDI